MDLQRVLFDNIWRESRVNGYMLTLVQSGLEQVTIVALTQIRKGFNCETYLFMQVPSTGGTILSTLL
jgi:hypothetical protein